MTYDTLAKIRRLLGEAVLLPIPEGQKGCKVKNWPRLIYQDTLAPKYFRRLMAHVNTGVLLGKASGDLATVDCDGDEQLRDFLACNPDLRETLITRGARGGNVWLRMDGEFPDTYRLTCRGVPWGEFRSNGAQTVIAGIHPAGMSYRMEREAAPLRTPFSAIRWPDGVVRGRPAATRRGRRESSSGGLHSVSPASLDPASLYNTPTPATLIRASVEFAKAHPVLHRSIEDQLAPFLPLTEGSRNTVLTCQIAPLLFGAFASGPAFQILEYLIRTNQLGGYSPAEARDKFRSAFAALEWNYTGEGAMAPLNPAEREAYLVADAQIRDAFRICRSFALYPHPKYPPPAFFLSSGEFAARLGFPTAMSAWRMLRYLEQFKLLKRTSPGTNHTGGKAAEFLWLLYSP